MTLDTPLMQEWRARAREVADKHVRPVAWDYDTKQEYPWEILQAIADNDLLKVWIPKEYGGMDGGNVGLCVVVEELSRACGGVGVMFAVNALGSYPILLGGTDEQKEKWLPRIASGETLISFGLSEKNAGSDAGSMTCRAEEKDGTYVINGEKKWNTNGGIAGLYTIFAVTDPDSRSRRISGLLVEKDTPGFTIGKVEDKMGIRCVPVVELNFEDCEVPEENLLGGRAGLGFKHAMMTLDHARPGVAAQAVGLAQGALDFAVLYSTRREQFGKPISGHGMIQELLAKMSAKVEAARRLVYAAAEAVDAKAPEMNLMAAQAKLFATNAAMEVTTDAVQVFGGYGYMKDYPIEKFMRDAKITQIYEGTNQVQALVVARNLIKGAGELEHLADFIPLPGAQQTSFAQTPMADKAQERTAAAGA